ncbi:MAG: hypothetical protein COX07_06680 [Bacteroidetes bacterium CG23_combo_of_CG06-09_8_20_14_all_32_9]|nr:MAG: hypothetical protein COX07_06680 [Bacteroidetes bacterium CG23_combo_of_CG06-09_8_20_14_all_32_9]
MNKKGAIILEYVWLALTIFAALTGSYKVIKNGFDESYIFFIIAVVAAFMFILRHAMRRYTNNNKADK